MPFAKNAKATPTYFGSLTGALGVMPYLSVREVHIISYFSLDTDLAAEMRSWPEYSTGAGYNVRLSSNLESVEVSLTEEEEQRFVVVRGTGTGELFDRVLGRVIHALAAHSDNLMIDRVS